MLVSDPLDISFKGMGRGDLRSARTLRVCLGRVHKGHCWNLTVWGTVCMRGAYLISQRTPDCLYTVNMTCDSFLPMMVKRLFRYTLSCAVCNLVCGRQQGWLLRDPLLPAALHEPYQDLCQQVMPHPQAPSGMHMTSAKCSLTT